VTVTSKPIENGKPVETRAAPKRESLAPAGIAALMFGIPLWFVGARYTLDGWRLGVNIAALHVGLPIDIPVITGWWSLLLVPVGSIYSFVEVRYNPIRFFQEYSFTVALIFLVLWGATHGTDLGSTFLSATTIQPDAWAISKWIAEHLWAATLWTVFLTYLSERLILAGIKWTGLSMIWSKRR
jgi:hypothetical protein